MDLLAFINEGKTVLLDGAMGTQLAARGLEMSCVNNISHPDTVLAIHRDYIRCGCDVLITNTLTMNRIYIESSNMDVDIEAANRAGVELAREAAQGGQFVLGDMSSTGQMLEPYGSCSEKDAYETFKEQAGILAGSGVDGFILETYIDLREALCAVRACRDAASLPILATVSFTTTAGGGRTVMGNTAGEAAQQLTEAGACALGVNCGDLSPAETSEIIMTMRRHTTLPLIAQPNAGKPRLKGGQTIFDMQPAAFAEGILKCIEAGAGLVGGCCGTSPEHILALARLTGKA